MVPRSSFHLLCFAVGWIIVSTTVLTVRATTTNTPNNNMTPAKPSFLFLLIDDVGWADFSYNNGTAQTPNIDKWAETDAVTLQDFHSGGTVCSPTRATVLTGRNHFRDCVDYVYGCSDMRTCVPDFEFAPMKTFTVADAVRSADEEGDYRSFFAGKWHLGSFFNDSELYGGLTSSPTSHGFHHFHATVGCAATYTTNCQCKDGWPCHFGHYNDSFHFCYQGDPDHCCFNYWYDDPQHAHGVNNVTEPTEPDDALYIVDAFSHFLDEHAGQPFLSQLSFHNCHIPFIGSSDAVEACSKNETCRPPTNGIPYTPEELDYYACLTQLDTAIGRLLDKLQATGYYENTLIWFGSDNGPEHNCPPQGFCQNAFTDPARPVEGPGSAGPLRGRKRDIYEGGHRVPGLVSWPAYTPGGFESWETVSTVDFLPTVLDVLGVDRRPPEQEDWAMDGRSILPVLQGSSWVEAHGDDRELGVAFYNPHLSLVDGYGYRYGKWKYVVGSTSCKEDSCEKAQLYDLEADLREQHDLSEDEPVVLQMMEEKFRIWHNSVIKSRKEESNCSKAELEFVV